MPTCPRGSAGLPDRGHLTPLPAPAQALWTVRPYESQARKKACDRDRGDRNRSFTFALATGKTWWC